MDLARTSTSCPPGTTICKVDKSQATKTSLGLTTGHQFYVEDDIVKVVFQTEQICDKDKQKKISSILQFHCNPWGDSKPQFLFDSMDCTYMFTWENPHTCAHPFVVNPKPLPVDKAGTGNGSTGSKSGGTVWTIVAVFLSAIVICLLLIVFHKKERRDAVSSRLRGLFRRHSSSYRYSEIPSSEVEDLLPEISASDLGIQGSVQVTTDSEDISILRSEESPAVISYHDDSDEELLA